jgi:hypothetical protein
MGCFAIGIKPPFHMTTERLADNSPWLDGLAGVRQRATREGRCYQHVQAITVAIDPCAENALGNRDYFLNKPCGAGLLRLIILLDDQY